MKLPDAQRRILLRCGLAGGPLFLASLALFGALTPGHSHAHKSVSELGGLGTPWGWWFDFFGLLLPGLAVVGLAWELRRRLRSAGARTWAATGLLVFGGMFALTAIPADFSRMFKSPLTWLHAFFAFGSPLVFFALVPGCAKALVTLGAAKKTARIFLLLGYLPAAEFLLYGVFPNSPGLVQRLIILTLHALFAWFSWLVLGLESVTAAARTPGKTPGLDAREEARS